MVVPVLFVITYPFPDLSFHVSKFPDEVVIDVESAASNHNPHPGILRGSKPEMLLDGIIASLEQNIIGG